MTLIEPLKAAFRGLHLKTKLAVAFAVLVAFTAIISYQAYQSLTRLAVLNDRAQSLFVHDLMGVSAIEEAAIFQVKSTRVLRDAVLASGDREAVADQKDTLEELQTSVLDSLDAAGEAFEDTASKEKLAEVREKLPAYHIAAEKIMQLAADGDREGAKEMLKQTNSLANSINLTIAETARLREEAAQRSRSGAETTYKRVRLPLILLALGALILAASLSIQLVRHLGIVQESTERRQAAESLSESEERCRLMADGCPSMMWVTGAAGEAEYINKAYQKFVGTTDAEVKSGKWHVQLHPDDAPEYVSAFNRARSEQALFRAEARVRRADGEWRLLGSNALPWLSPGGAYIGHIGVCADITERKQSDEALRNSEEKFRQLAENIQEVFWMMNVDGTEILYVGPAYEQIWGRTCASLYAAPMDWIEAIHPDDREHAHETFLRQLQGESIDSEYRIHRPDGQEKWIRDRAFPIRDQDGQLIRIAGIAEEITERKQSEILLRRNADRLTLATRAGGVGIFSQDLSNGVLDWDDQMFRLHGITKDQFGGVYEAWQDLLHPEDRQRVKEESGAVLRGEKEFDSEYRVVWPDGSIHHIRGLGLINRDEDGKAIRIVGTNWDITGQKHAAEALLEGNRQLEKETSRANRLAIEAEQANAAKSGFLANMSHEIRTPMNGVIGMTELLLDSDLTPEQRRYAETVRASGESLLVVINDVLDFSKIEAGKLELDIMDFNLNELLDDLGSALALQAHAKGLEFYSIAGPEVPVQLRGDPGRLRQILTNLAGNAIKFTEKGEVAVRASLAERGKSDCVLRFSVRDTGIGIPADKISTLFEKFSQVDASTTRKYGGTGLGLAISRQLAEMMEGGVSVTSHPGRGSEFLVTVRLGLGRQSELVETGSSVPAALNLRGVRVLIVDDNATGREILTTLTGSLGMRPVEVESGPLALQALNRAVINNDPFRIAVIDMQMPDMDGEALGRAIKSDARLADTRMVMLTSLGTFAAINHEEIGFSSQATKPVRRETLIGLLSKALSESNASGPVLTITPATSKPPLVRDQSLHFDCIDVRILLAEDNITNQQVALGILKKFGLSADIANNGAEAVKALESIPYDLVLMDVQMPIMGGIEATREIRNMQSSVLNHNIPIIAMTANAMQSDRDMCIESGMNDFLPKPISSLGFRAALDRWLPKGECKPAAVPGQQVDCAAGESETVVFDQSGVLERMMDDSDLVTLVIETFLADMPLQIEQLQAHLESGDLPASMRHVHTIKGAASNVGGERLRKLAAQMEKSARAGELSAVIDRMVELRARFLQLQEAIKQEWRPEENRLPGSNSRSHAR